MPRLVLAALAVLSLTGCPQTAPDSNNGGSNNGGSNNGGSNNGGLNNSAPNNEGTNNGEPNNGTNNGDPNNRPTEVMFRLVPRYEELLPPGTSPSPVEFALTPTTDGEFEAVVDWPAGVFAPEIMVDGALAGPFNNGTDGTIGRLSSDLKFPVMNPAPRTFRLVVTLSGNDDPIVQLTQTSEDAPIAVGATEHHETVGSWFDEVFRARDDGQGVVDLLDAVRAHGGPIRSENGVLFIVPARDDETPPQIRGTWNGWAADPAATLVRVAPMMWARWIDIPEGRQEYKVVYGDGETWVTDLSNPHIAWDGLDPGGVGDFNSVLNPDAERSRLAWLPAFHSPQLGDERDVYVWLPGGYRPDGTKLPALYVHDGNESIVRGRFHEVATTVTESDPQTRVILVFVALPTQNVRIAQYTMGTADSRGDAYVDFIADTLVPFVDANFATESDRGSRGLNGASLGGLISVYGAMQRPDVFGYAAGMSSSFFWEDGYVLDEMQTRGCQNVTWYIDSGSPNDNYDVTLQMSQILDTLGCEYEYVLEQGGQHDWTYWNRRFGGVLSDFSKFHGR